MKTFESRTRTFFFSASMALFFARPVLSQGRPCIAPLPADSAAWTPPLDRPVIARAGVVTLRDALDRIAAATRVRLSYSAESVPLDTAVCLSANGAPIGQVLSTLLTRTNVHPVAVGADQIVLAPRFASDAPRPPASSGMARTTSVLDRVVVTGSAITAPQRDATVGLSTLGGQQLARERTTTLSGALDGNVPGVWSWPQSPSSVITTYGSLRGASSFGLSYPKIYIDGIEVANPLLVTRFNPDAIERIEVIRGPQGSALYGPDAISGVINIITRHEGTGADGTHASLRTSGGVVQSDFAKGTLAQSHTLSLVGGTNTRSADLHISASSVGDFIPDGASRDFMATGSARVVGERSTLSATARYFVQEAGGGSSPLVSWPTEPRYDSIGQAFGARDAVQSVNQFTLGGTATYAANDRWTHSATVGLDGYRLANVRSAATIPAIALQDSALRAAEGSAVRGTLRASSALRVSDTDAMRATLTFTAEHGVYRASTPLQIVGMVAGATAPQSGALTATVSALPRSLTAITWQSSTGLTAQANAAFDDRLYVTGGLRLERDSRLPGSQIAALPMLGVASVRDYGPFTVKVRGAYGQGIRPASAFGHLELWQGAYGGWIEQKNLGAEKQAGTEAGFDLMLRRAWSLRVTRFDQRASGLIQLVAVPADETGRSRSVRYDLENVGEISNSGWELETSANVSRLSLAATLSLVRSRVENVANGYRGDLRAGDRMLQVPARTASVSASWLGRGWSASIGASQAFDWINYDEIALATAYLNSDRPLNELVGQRSRDYWRKYDGGLRVRAALTRDVRDLFTVEISGDNLLNFQRNEPDNLTIVPGRTLMTGVKLRF